MISPSSHSVQAHKNPTSQLATSSMSSNLESKHTLFGITLLPTPGMKGTAEMKLRTTSPSLKEQTPNTKLFRLKEKEREWKLTIDLISIKIKFAIYGMARVEGHYI